MNNQTLEKLRQLRFYGMHDAFKTSLENTLKEQMTQDQFIHHLVASEWDNRRNRAIARAIKQASFRYSAFMEEIDYTLERGLDRNQVERLAALDFIRDNKNVFITGPTGTGKSYLATALGNKACQEGCKVLYANTAKLMGQLKIAKVKGTILGEFKRIERVDLLILDDFAMQSFDSQSRGIMMDIIEDRHQKKSTMITSQVPVKDWYDAIGEKTVADAILDRLVHDSLRVVLYGESIRKRKAKNENSYQ
ncbi:MAG: IS21-like element helper ATPase IstB [Proteiniphilum sp.]|uniref:IS21-like element helper ATPase IstB n=1 Tax=Proteiniphilum sp. TaxID=1926877 RepID=UPI002B21F7D9|nr:IS21-like element helper ATPase IstB [Proteiniphilum sp.]MEA5128315.1 IS21-like element helper ATPase IstB [Proteiniphilum sp.]